MAAPSARGSPTAGGAAGPDAMRILRVRVGHERLLADYYRANRTHLEPWTPALPDGYADPAFWRRRLERREADGDRSAHFMGAAPDGSRIIALCSLNRILRGALDCCDIGYSVDRHHEGRGCMKRLAVHAIRCAFDELGLHRITAHHMPANKRSAGLLKALGFEREGRAREYLLVNGRREDHVLSALVRGGKGGGRP